MYVESRSSLGLVNHSHKERKNLLGFAAAGSVALEKASRPMNRYLEYDCIADVRNRITRCDGIYAERMIVIIVLQRLFVANDVHEVEAKDVVDALAM